MKAWPGIRCFESLAWDKTRPAAQTLETSRDHMFNGTQKLMADVSWCNLDGRNGLLSCLVVAGMGVLDWRWPVLAW